MQFDPPKAIEAQKRYCEEKQVPHFAPYNGICWNCNRNIYELHYWKYENHVRKSANPDEVTLKTGISVEEAGSELVTGCPHCNRSYCD